jgi:hypothetical protein
MLAPMPPPDEDIRASDGEREQAIERLRVAAGEGRLGLEELGDRIEAQLESIVADLPASSAAAPAALASVPTRNTAFFRDLRREGRWAVPSRSRWDAHFGDVVLDLRDAVIAGAVVEVRATSVYGDLELLVPDGVLVEVRARTVFGDVKQDAGEVAPAGAPTVVVTGWTVFGDVKVRTRRKRESLAERWLG